MALVIGDADRTSYASTLDVYRCFAAACGQDSVALQLPESGGEDNAARTCAELLRPDPSIDSLLVLVDAFAIEAVRAARSLGRSIPADLRIATRYNGPRAMECKPPLTAVDLQLDEVGAIAVRRLLTTLQMIEPAGNQQLPAQALMVRASTGA